MKRTQMVRKPKRRKAAAMRILHASKVDTRSKVSKGPARSPEHLALVRRQPCLLTGCDWRTGYIVVAHHLRGMFPRSMGKD